VEAVIRALILTLALSGCVATASPDAGCAAYGEARATMPRPLVDEPLPQWVAALDSRMTGACT
jgi:hypothetical protein